MDTLNLVILALLLSVGVVRFIKKAIDIGLLIGPPLLLITYTNFSIKESFVYWFLLVDFFKTNIKIIQSFFNHLLNPLNLYKYKVLGKLSSLLASAFTIYAVVLTYFNLLNKILDANNVLDVLSIFISSYIFISIIKGIYFTLFKNKKRKSS